MVKLRKHTNISEAPPAPRPQGNPLRGLPVRCCDCRYGQRPAEFGRFECLAGKGEMAISQWKRRAPCPYFAAFLVPKS